MASARIALDAFGADASPDVELDAAIEAARAGFEIHLVGDDAVLREGFSRRQVDADALGIRFVPASDRITMSDSPAMAVRSKPNASMPVAFDYVRAGEADAVVSAGNSGAMLACGLFKFGRVRGVERPAIVTKFPRADSLGIMLDVGANIECAPSQLVQFATMGAVFARLELGRQKGDVRVALLSNGSEESKGTRDTRAAATALTSEVSTEFKYLGYREGHDIYDEDADVIVTDGFTGNVVLKLVEGSAQLYKRFPGAGEWPDELRTRFNAETYGGAPLLGVDGLAVISHGASSPTALVNAIRVAAHFAERDLTAALASAIAEHTEMTAAARRARDELA